MKYLKSFENYTNENETVLSFNKLDINEIPKEFLPLKNNLVELHCHHCRNLSVLPELPNTLKVLWCYETVITELPKLPNTLKVLWCYDTVITVLPELPDSLTSLWCANNKISILPDFPKNLDLIYIGNNPWIEPIPFEWYNNSDDRLDIYNKEQKKKFQSYEFQKEFVEKYPLRLKDLNPIGINREIRKEYAYLFDFDQYFD